MKYAPLIIVSQGALKHRSFMTERGMAVAADHARIDGGTPAYDVAVHRGTTSATAMIKAHLTGLNT